MEGRLTPQLGLKLAYHSLIGAVTLVLELEQAEAPERLVLEQDGAVQQTKEFPLAQEQKPQLCPIFPPLAKHSDSQSDLGHHFRQPPKSP